MKLFFVYAYLFQIGACYGWTIELFFRRFVSRKKWVNPGFCVGPVLPLYGSGLCVLYTLSSLFHRLGWHTHLTGYVLYFICACLGMTILEYITGLVCLKWFKVRLWDYSMRPGNFQGIICPLYSFFWGVMAMAFELLLYEYFRDILMQLAQRPWMSFVLGLFYGVFIIDVCYSARIITKLKQFAEEKNVVVRAEELKEHIHERQKIAQERAHFLFAYRSSHSLREYLETTFEGMEERSIRYKMKRKQQGLK